MRLSIIAILALPFASSLALTLMDAVGGGVGDAVFAGRDPEDGGLPGMCVILDCYPYFPVMKAEKLEQIYRPRQKTPRLLRWLT